MSRRGFRRIGGMAFCLVISFLFIPMVSGNFSIISDNNLVSSHGAIGNEGYRTYLKEVNITIDLFEDRTEGSGTYVLFNPGNETEDLEIFFDPSYYAEECSISVDGSDVELDELILPDDHYEALLGGSSFIDFFENEPYPVKVLNVNVPSNGSIEMEVEWETDPNVVIYEESSVGKNEIPLGEGYWKTKITDWGNTYLIFSNSSWTEPIDRFEITYHSHYHKSNDARIWLTTDKMEWIWSENLDIRPAQSDHVSVNMTLDEEGNDVVQIILENWSYDDTYIVYDGSDDREDVTPVASVSNLCCFAAILIPLLLVGSLVISIIYRKRK